MSFVRARKNITEGWSNRPETGSSRSSRALDSVEWARGVQEQVHRAEATESIELRPIALRIAVHVGDVMTTADDIYGDGVNVAARLQEYAEPGGVILSEAVYNLVRGTIGVQARDLGFLRLKNLRPVRAYALDGPRSSSIGPGWSRGSRPSIAVLPFVERGVPSEHSYFGDGVVEDIVGGLASLQELFVISRNSTLKYRERPTDLGLIGNELGVRYVLSGSIRRAENQLRISAELADAETLGVLWSDRVSGDLSDLFQLQDRLAERVVQTIAPNIYRAEIQRVARKRTENLGAYDYLLRGLDLIYRLTPQEFNQAHEMFEKSIELRAMLYRTRLPHCGTAYGRTKAGRPIPLKTERRSTDLPRPLWNGTHSMSGHFPFQATSGHCCFAISKPPWCCLIALSTPAQIRHSCGRAAVPHFVIWGTEQRPGVEPRRRYVCRRSIRRSFSPMLHWATPPTRREISKTRLCGDDMHMPQTQGTQRTSDFSPPALRPPAPWKKRVESGKPCSS
jgi:TolB-like protein